MRRSPRGAGSFRGVASPNIAWPLLMAGVLLAAAGAGAGKAKVYKYETRDGKVDYGIEVPPGAVVLAEVGETEVVAGTTGPPSSSPATTPPGGRTVGREAGPISVGGASRGSLELGQSFPVGALRLMIHSLAAQPLVALLFAAATFAWSVAVLRAFPPLFSTLDLDWRRCARLATLVFVGWAFVALLGSGLQVVWNAIQWSPSEWLEERTLGRVALLLYALVPVVAFAQRLGVSVGKAVLLALLWFTLVIGPAWLVWAVVLP